MEISRRIFSPNFNERKNGAKPEYVILHFTVIEGTDEVCEFLCDESREVSAHYVIGQDGEIVQLVEEINRAWHAGRSSWMGQDDLNSRSIGIEIVNNGAEPFREPQYLALMSMLPEICGRWDIPPQNVIGHADIAPARKYDPGPWFDWARLDAAGLSEPPSANIKSNDFWDLARSAGYDVDTAPEDVLVNIRIRHGATPYFGVLRDEDFALLRK